MQALLLDFGSVVTYTAFELMPTVERYLGLGPGSLPWRGPFDPAGDELWQRVEAGELTDRAYWIERARIIYEVAGREGSVPDLLHACVEGDLENWTRPEVPGLVADAQAAGLAVGMLSNELELFLGPGFEHAISLFARLDAVVDCSSTPYRKPDAEAYLESARRLGAPVEEILFVDDLPGHVAGAELVGMPALVFEVTDAPGSIATVRDRLGLPGPA